jgi:hypothetical protein
MSCFRRLENALWCVGGICLNRAAKFKVNRSKEMIENAWAPIYPGVNEKRFLWPKDAFVDAWRLVPALQRQQGRALSSAGYMEAEKVYDRNWTSMSLTNDVAGEIPAGGYQFLAHDLSQLEASSAPNP